MSGNPKSTYEYITETDTLQTFCLMEISVELVYEQKKSMTFY